MNALRERRERRAFYAIKMNIKFDIPIRIWQTWLSREDRLCARCPKNEVKTELHFLTSSQMYDHIRDTYFPQITQIDKEFENKPDFDKFPYLLGEIPRSAITAARCVTCCHKKSATSEKQTPS